jgi:hypothetical protein
VAAFVAEAAPVVALVAVVTAQLATVAAFVAEAAPVVALVAVVTAGAFEAVIVAAFAAGTDVAFVVEPLVAFVALPHVAFAAAILVVPVGLVAAFVVVLAEASQAETIVEILRVKQTLFEPIDGFLSPELSTEGCIDGPHLPARN